MTRHQHSRLQQQLQSVREAQPRRSGSVVDAYREEIEYLALEGGASQRELSEWLEQYKGVRVHPTTIGRRLARWSRQL